MTVVENTPQAWDERSTLPWSWQAAMWSHQGQEIRFKTVRDALRVVPGDSVLDYGCGTGRFRTFLEDVRYYGFDWSPLMRERAKHDLTDWRNVEILEDIDDIKPLREWDHVVAIGTFNLRNGWTRVATWEALDSLWTRTRKTLVVCLYRGLDPACLNYLTSEGYEWARDKTPSFVVDTGYLDNDFMVVLRR